MKWLAPLLLCSPAFATPSFYQFCSQGVGGVAASSANCGSTTGDHTFTHTTVQPNDLLIVGVRTNVGVSSISDTRGLTWFQATTGAGAFAGSWFYAQTGGAAAANDTITVNITASSTFWGITVVECQGCSTAAGVTIAANNGTGTGTTLSVPSFTTNNTNELILASGLSFNRQTWTAGGSFTMRFTESGNNGLLLEDELQAAAGSVNPTATGSSSVNWVGAGAAFRTAAGSYSFVQVHQNTDQSGSSHSTFSVTMSSTGAGHFLACGANWFGGSFASLTDTNGDVFTPYSAEQTDNHGDHIVNFYAYNIASGTTSITMHGSAMTFLEIVCAEYSGVAATSNPLDMGGPVDLFSSCSSNCAFSGSGSFTSNTNSFPSGYSPSSGLMTFTCGGGTCVAELDALLIRPASGPSDFAVEYGDYSGANSCTGVAPQWNQITEDSNGSQWCYNTALAGSGGFSNAFTF